MKNIFLPNKNNDFYPHILKPAVFALIITTLIVAKLLIFSSQPKATLRASDLTIENILAAVNNERALRNIPTLNTDSRLSNAAQQKSDDMQTRHYFAHVDPDGNYVWNKIVAAGYSPYAALGENLAIEFFSTESLVQAWMNSPTHRQNVLNTVFLDQGMGLAFGNPDQNQYHSAITNTFGALQNEKPKVLKIPAPAPTQTPTASPATKPTKTKIQKAVVVSQNPAPTPALTPTPTPTINPSFPDINVRSGFENNVQSTKEPTSVPTPSATNVQFKETEPQISVVGDGEKLYKQNGKLNLGLAAVLILLLLADLKLFQVENFPGLDKKLNNLTLLALAVVLTALLYLI